MILYYSNYKLASGHDNAGALSSIETILGREGVHPFPFGTYSPGVMKIRGDGTVYIAGQKTAKWPFRFILWSMHKTLMTSYCNGGYSGLVTVRTRADDSSTYANYNATMILPLLPEVRTESQRFEDYVITFTRMVAI